MRKIEIKNDIKILGYGIIKQGVKFFVENYTKRYIYVVLPTGCKLKLTKKDINIIY